MNISFTINSGLKINAEMNYPDNPRSGVIILIHGLGEHLGRYEDWTGRFVDKGFAVIRADLMGHGESEGLKGHVSGFEEYHELIERLISIARDEYPVLPVILYGHSLGGTIVLDYIISGTNGLDLAVVTSPWIRLSFEPSGFKVALAKIARRIAPRMIQPSGLNARHLSHDQEVVSAYINDPLVHSSISAAMFFGVYNSSKYIAENAARVDIPVLLLHGTDDLITSPEASKQFAGGSDKVDLRLWNGGYHELHNEPFKDEVFNEIYGWIKSTLPG